MFESDNNIPATVFSDVVVVVVRLTVVLGLVTIALVTRVVPVVDADSVVGVSQKLYRTNKDPINQNNL